MMQRTILHHFRNICLLLFIISGFISALNLTIPIFMVQLYDRVMTSQSVETLTLLTIICVGAFITYGFLEWGRSAITWRFAEWLQVELTPSIAKASVKANVSGRAVDNSVLHEMSVIGNTIRNKGIIAILELPWSLGFLIVLSLIHPGLGLFALLVALLLVLLAVIAERISRGSHQDILTRRMQNDTWLGNCIREAESVHSMSMLGNILTRHLKIRTKANSDAQYSTDLIDGIDAATRAIRQIAQIGIMSLAAVFMLTGDLSPGLVVGSSILMARMLMPIEALASSWRPLMRSISALQTVEKLLQDHGSKETSIAPPPLTGDVTIQSGGKFAPGSLDKYLLRSLSIRFSAGQIVALVGASGSGKSTLCKLIAGNIDLDVGEIRFDGNLRRNWPDGTFGTQIGYLPQEVSLPPSTVSQAIARMAEKPDMGRVYAAAKQVEADDLIKHLPNSYDTKIGAGGSSLSGGQTQSIGLARALYGEPHIVILDEPDAHLDGAGRVSLCRTLLALKSEGKVIIVATHSMQIIQCCDQVASMRSGTIQNIQSLDSFNIAAKESVREFKIKNSGAEHESRI